MEEKKLNQQVVFEGRLVPSPALIDGEQILDTFEVEVGLIGTLLRHKERLVVTTHRIFQFSRKLTSANLKCLELKSAEAIDIRTKINVVQFLIGIILLGGAIVYGIHSLLQIFRGPRIESAGEILLCLIIAVIGISVLLGARKTVLKVSGVGWKNYVALRVIRIEIKESKRFVDVVTKVIRSLNTGVMAEKEVSRSRFCSKCGAKNEQADTFCKECGARLE